MLATSERKRNREQARSHRKTGFSLIEVILAVGIFAGAVTVILALLPALTRQAAGSSATLTALHLPDAIRGELLRLARVGGLDALAGQAVPQVAPLPATLQLVASRDAARIQSLVYLPPPAPDQIAADEQYFLIEVWQFTQSDLAFDAAGAGLALQVRVAWPYRIPGTTVVTPADQREQVGFTLSLTR